MQKSAAGGFVNTAALILSTMMRKRITSPMLRLGGKLEPVSWDEALQAVAERVGKASARI